jgi:hypothetical protein
MSDLNKLNVNIDADELRNISKKYKKLKKYMRSPLYEVKKMDGNEKVISNLLKDIENLDNL